MSQETKVQTMSQKRLNDDLMISIQELNGSEMKKLIEKKADVNYVDKHGDTPLMTAMANNCDTYARYLVEKGANVNHEDKQRLTPLMYAIDMADVDLVDFLIDNGADTSFLKKDATEEDIPNVYLFKKLYQKLLKN